jgi:hypothetical protein
MNTGTPLRIVAKNGCVADRVLQISGLPYSPGVLRDELAHDSATIGGGGS